MVRSSFPPLPLIKVLIRPADQTLFLVGLGTVLGDADAHGDRERVKALRPEERLENRTLQFLRPWEGVSAPRAGKEDEKFVSAEADRDISFPFQSLDEVGDMKEGLIADKVPPAVIDL